MTRVVVDVADLSLQLAVRVNQCYRHTESVPPKTAEKVENTTPHHLLAFDFPTIRAGCRFRKVDQRVNFVSAKIRVDTVKIRLVLHTLPEVLALAHDMAKLVVPIGAQSV